MSNTPDTFFGGVFKIATDTTTNTVTIGGLSSLEPSFDVGESDSSSLEDATTYSSFLPTRTSYSFSGNLKFDPGSAEHEKTVLNQLNVVRNFEIVFTDHTTLPSKWLGTGFFTSFTPSMDDETMSAGFSFRGTGAPTFTGVA